MKKELAERMERRMWDILSTNYTGTVNFATYDLPNLRYKLAEVVNEELGILPDDIITVPIICDEEFGTPEYATEGSAGFDLRASILNKKQDDFKGTGFTYICTTIDDVTNAHIILMPKGRVLIPTGNKIQLPKGYELQVRPRSGLAIKNGIGIVNSPGTVDEDYTGDVGVILVNHSDSPFEIKQGDRIAQGICNKYTKVKWIRTGELKTTDRGEGGFGHTGIQEVIAKDKEFIEVVKDVESFEKTGITAEVAEEVKPFTIYES